MAILAFALGLSVVPDLLRKEGVYQNTRTSLGLLFAGGACVYLAYSTGLRGKCNQCKGIGYENPYSVKEQPEPPPEPITDDQSCHKCGYNVRTLKVGGTCPECGETIMDKFAAESYLKWRSAYRQFILGNAVLLCTVVIGLLVGGLQGIPFGFAMFFALLGLWSGVAIVVNREFMCGSEKSFVLVGTPAVLMGWSIIVVSAAAVSGIIIAGYYWFF